MILDWTISLGNLLTILTIVIGLITYKISRINDRRLTRAKFVRDYTLDFYGSEEVSKLFLEIDYGKFKFDETMLGSDREIHLGRLLDILNSLGFYCKNKIIGMRDIDNTTLGYAIVRVYTNSEIAKYLEYVDARSKVIGMNEIAYEYFKTIGSSLAEARISRNKVPG